MKNLYSSSMILAFVLCASYAQTQVTFTDMGSMLQSIGTVSYADCAADMDGDGYDDVVRVVSNGIYIDYQQANGSFAPAFFPMSITNLPSWSICAADIDGNGYTDLLLGAGNAVSFVYANDNGTGFIEDAHPEYIFTQ
ncbi:MAG: FG-GAP repeat domain-containing protein, partial [Flavobacteriales bacterium]